MKITANFTYREFYHSDTAIRHGINNVTDDPVITGNIHYLCQCLLQPVRDRLGIPIRVTSGYRCARLNTLLGGARNSQHMTGEAADLVCADNQLLFDTIRDSGLEFDQLIDESGLSWVHVSLKKEGNRKQILKL